MAVVGLAAAFGLVALTPEKTVSIEAFLLAVLPIVQALATERKVYSPETHMRELEVDYEAGYKAGKEEVQPWSSGAPARGDETRKGGALEGG